MPVNVETSEFVKNQSTTPTTFYQGNAGDFINVSIQIRSIIRISSINNPLTLDPTLNVVTSPAVSWIDEGFRVGDWVRCSRYTSGGALTATFISFITYVDATNCDFGAFPYFYDISNNEIFEIYALDWYGNPATSPPPTAYVTSRKRDDLDIFVNHAKQGVAGNEFSLIDGEATRYKFINVEGMAVGGIMPSVPVGNQSGQMVTQATLTRFSDDANNWAVHNLDITFYNTGMFDESWFDFAGCLKLYVEGRWASLSGQPFDPYVFTYDQDADTGWFNEPFNTGTPNSTLDIGITEIDYSVPTSHQIQITGNGSFVGLGGCYISTDDSYYKNKLDNQRNLSMVVPTSKVNTVAPPTFISPTNPVGAGYTIEVTNVSLGGVTKVIDFDFIPNPDFATFMENREDGDRLFYLWVNYGDTNHLAFADQLTKEPPVGGELKMITDFGFLDHSENVTAIQGDKVGFKADTEDDIAYFGRFRLDTNAIYDYFQVRIEAFNSVTGDDFTLQETNFSFAGVQMSNLGQYLLNETQTIVTTLPSTSLKNDAIFKLDILADNLPNEYGVSIYYPFLLNWKYWLAQNNASVDFYPDQNKNWEQYDNIANWGLRAKLTLVKDGLGYIHTNQFINNKYDHEPLILQTIQMIRDVNNNVVNVIPDGELMRIRATCVNLSGAWDQNKVWGMLTIEPKEAEQRWICSSIVPYDNNSSNPLYPLATPYIQIVYPTPDTAILECYFNTQSIDMTNGVKVTCKIKENCEEVGEQYKITTDDQEKNTTSDELKLKA